MTKSIESKNSRININFKQDIINGKHLTTGFRSFNKEHEKNNHIIIEKSSPDSCVKCYTMFLPFLLIKIDVFS
ncbi:putative lipoprotein [Staphylococcus aureus]|nr:putative lipoprotein [Staphylococcus aureus]